MQRERAIPLLVGLVFGILILLLIPLQWQKYRVKLQGHFNKTPHFESFDFADFDGDGTDEVVACGGAYPGNTALRDQKCSVNKLSADYRSINTIDQANVPKLLEGTNQAISADLNQDSISELYIASSEGKHLFLHAFEGTDFSTFRFKLFLDTAAFYKGKHIIKFDKIGVQDVNQDGYLELYFNLSNGYPIHPRRTYRLNIADTTVVAGPLSCANFGNINDPLSVNFNLFSGHSQMAGNFDPGMTIPYPDSVGYAYALNADLKLQFEPVPLTSYPGYINNQIWAGKLFTFSREKFDTTTNLYLFDPYAGKQLAHQSINQAVNLLIPDTLQGEAGMKILGEHHLFYYNQDLQLIQKRRLPITSIGATRFVGDINGDGYREFISNDSGGKYWLWTENFKAYTEIQLPWERLSGSPDYHLRQREGYRELVIENDGKLAFYTFTKNSGYWLQWPYYLLVLAISILSSHYTFLRFRQNMERRFALQTEMTHLQLRSLKNQVDPHFTLNALNAIDWMYQSGKPDKARLYLGKMSRLMHRAVSSSENIQTNLYEELEFCQKFLELEQMRHPDLKFSIEVHSQYDPLVISFPRQLLHIFVENALKHGLKTKANAKEVSISVRDVASQIQITVYDNGVGMGNAPSSSQNTGKGLQLAAELIRLYNNLHKNAKVDFNFEENLTQGTKVVVQVAVENTHV